MVASPTPDPPTPGRAPCEEMLSCSRRISPVYGGRMLLRDAKEAFREGHHASRRTAEVSVRALSTKQGRVDVEEAVVLDRVIPPSARPRSGGGGSKGGVKMGGALGLKEFIHRARVLDLYRGILKRARSIEDEDVAAEARRQFKVSRDEIDPLKIQMLVADATNHLEAMQGSTRGAGSSGGGGSWLDIDDPEDKRGRVGEEFPWQR